MNAECTSFRIPRHQEIQEATLADSENRIRTERSSAEERGAERTASEREGGGSDGDRRGSDGDRRRSAKPRRGGLRRRNRVCQFCVETAKSIDYKAVSLLRQYINERGRILPRRRTAACAKHQRMLSRAIKRARHVALLPYTGEHVRATG